MLEARCKSQEIITMKGNFNTKIGNERMEDLADPHGLGIKNDRGDRLTKWIKVNDLVTTNDKFRQHPRRNGHE